MIVNKKNILSSLLWLVIGLIIGSLLYLVDYRLLILMPLLLVTYKYFGILKDKLLYLPILFIFFDFIFKNVKGFNSFSTIWDEALMLLLLGLIIYRNLKERISLRLSSFDIPILQFFLIGIFLLLFNSEDISIGIQGFRAIFQYILWYFIFYHGFIRKKDIMNAFILFSLVGFFLGSHAIYQYIIGVEIPSTWIDPGETIRTRAFSIIGSPNILGDMLVLLIPIAFGLFLTQKRLLVRGFELLNVIIMILGLVFTFTRGAWIAFAFSVFIFTLFVSRKLIIHYVILGSSGLLVSDSIATRLLYIFTPEYIAKSFAGGRLLRWIKGLEELEKSKSLGVGMGRFGGAVALNNNLSTFYLDNYHLKTLVEIGILGFSSYFLMHISNMIILINKILHSENKRIRFMLMSVFAAISGVLMHSFFENIFELPSSASYFWMILGLGSALSDAKE
jgi:O-antigen ligase